MIQSYFYVDENNKSVGPYSIEELMKQPITPDTYVWTNGMTNWQKLSEIQSLYERYMQKDILPEIPIIKVTESENNRPIYSGKLEESQELKDKKLLYGSLTVIFIIAFSYLYYQYNTLNFDDTDNFLFPYVDSTNQADNDLDNKNDYTPTKYEIVLHYKNYKYNEMVIKDIVFIKINSCEELKLHLLQYILQYKLNFPDERTYGSTLKKVFYEFKVFSDDINIPNLEIEVSLSRNIEDLHNFLKQNSSSFCALLYKSPFNSFDENLSMMSRP